MTIDKPILTENAKTIFNFYELGIISLSAMLEKLNVLRESSCLLADSITASKSVFEKGVRG